MFIKITLIAILLMSIIVPFGGYLLSKRNEKSSKNHKRNKIENVKKNRGLAHLYQKLPRNKYGYGMHQTQW